MTGNAALAELLHRCGFDAVFAMLGGSNVPWIGDAVERGSLRLVKTRHEDAAVTAAVGYARATGRPALASVTRGPGFTNAITALINAAKGHAPVLVVTGEARTPRLPSQDVDQGALAAAAGVGYREVHDIGELEEAVYHAVRAVYGTGTPQVLAVHSGVFGAEVELAHAVAPRVTPHLPPASGDIVDAVALLAGARHPLILAGTGADFAGSRQQLVALADATGARLATTLRALEMFAGHPADLGLCGGWSPPAIREQLALADVVFAVGASLNDFTTDSGTVFPDARIVHVEIDDTPRVRKVQPSITMRADARSAVAAVLEEWRDSVADPHASWGPVPSRERSIEEVLAPGLGHDPSRGIDPRHLYRRLDELLPADRVVVTDSGRFLGTIPTLLRSRDSRSWHVGNAYSAIGLGLGQAIGVAAAFPGRPVVLLAGDGGFAMSSHDLDAIRMNDLSLVVVIVDDELYGSDVKYLRQNGLPVDIIAQSLPDIPTLAAAYGGVGLVVRDLDELDRLDFRRRGLTLIDVRVDPEVNVRQVMAGWSETSTDRAAIDAIAAQRP